MGHDAWEGDTVGGGTCVLQGGHRTGSRRGFLGVMGIRTEEGPGRDGEENVMGLTGSAWPRDT